MATYTIEHVAQFDSALITPIADMLAQLTAREYPFGGQELRAIVEDTASKLCVMRDDERIMGILTLGHYTSPTGRKVWVEDVVVNAEYRGEGLGRKLINHAIEYCRENLSPCTLMLTSNPARIAANELYRTSGFEPKQTNVYKMTF